MNVTNRTSVDERYDKNGKLVQVTVSNGFTCPKCHYERVYLKTYKHGAVGAFCDHCGAYVKFLNPDERKWIFGFTKVVGNVELDDPPVETEQLTIDDLF